MQKANTFLQFENNESYYEELLDIIITKLKGKTELLKTEQVKQLGKGFEIVTRPWALLVCKDDKHLEDALASKCFAMFQGSLNAKPDERIWLDLVRVCRVDTVHQLRALMCSLHIKEATVKSEEKEVASHHILNWITLEKDSQPPSMVIVVDLLDYLVHDAGGYSTISDSELGQVLANLVESCIFESSFGTRDWEKDLGVKMNHFTELLITDSRCLRISQQEPEEATHIERLQRILHYYLDRSYPTSLTRNGY